MSKSYKDYYLEGQAQLQTGFEEQKKKRLESDAVLKAQNAGNIDKAAAVAAGKYQQSIDALPGKSQALYDQNAVNEAISRKQIEERLSNMGHRQSGLTGSMQTALTVQRGNADGQVRRQEQAQLLALENAIDDIYAKAETEKATYATAVDEATKTWEDGLLAQMNQNASSYASAAVAADKEAAAKVEAAKIEAAENEAKYSMTAMEQAAKLADLLYEGGSYKTTDEALYEAMKIYGLVDSETATGTGTDATAQVTAFVDTAIEYLDKFDFKISGWDAYWGNRENDGRKVGEAINRQLSGDATFARYSGEDKGNLLAIAVAKAVAEQWPTAGEVNDNQYRIEEACKTLGLGTEYAVFAKQIFAALNPLAGNQMAAISTGTGTATTTGTESSATKSTMHPKFLR